MSYPVGTICIGQKHIRDTDLNGMECVIIESARYLPEYICWRGFQSGGNVAYLVRWADGREWRAEHPNLKRKSDYDEEKRAEDRQKVSKLIAACKKAAESAIEAGVKVDQEEGAE